MKIKVVSWNIAGGRKTKSLGQFDYQEQDFNYFLNQIQLLSPEIICLQEVETEIESFAKKLGYKYFYYTPIHPSHINKNTKMGNAILSKFQFIQKNQTILPYPGWELFWPNGKLIDKHNKNLIKVKINNFYVATTHFLPLGLWGHNYYENQGIGYSQEIEKVLLKLSRPLILCGDLSGDFLHGNVPEIFSAAFKKLKLKTALPNNITRPLKKGNGLIADYIFYSPEFKLLASKIIPTQTDHYLCYAEFEI